ncbi:hypothetical protein AUP68_14753 [Ilyonectria robusta]
MFHGGSRLVLVIAALVNGMFDLRWETESQRPRKSGRSSQLHQEYYRRLVGARPLHPRLHAASLGVRGQSVFLSFRASPAKVSWFMLLGCHIGPSSGLLAPAGMNDRSDESSHHATAWCLYPSSTDLAAAAGRK